MKSIKYYISEAFKINKNTRIEKIDTQLISDIISVLEISKLIPEKILNKHRSKLYEVLGDFINEHGFTKITSIHVVNNTANGLDDEKLKDICDKFRFMSMCFFTAGTDIKKIIYDFGYRKKLLQVKSNGYNGLCLSKNFDIKDNDYNVTLILSFD